MNANKYTYVIRPVTGKDGPWVVSSAEFAGEDEAEPRSVYNRHALIKKGSVSDPIVTKLRSQKQAIQVSEALKSAFWQGRCQGRTDHQKENQ